MRLATTAVVLCMATALAFGASVPGMQTGKLELKSAGPIAFGPDGVLFVGDTGAASVVALDVHDNTPSTSTAGVEIKGIAEKIAALLGTTPDSIQINDVAVNPASRNVYLSVARGRGPDAAAVLLRAGTDGKISVVDLDAVAHSSVKLPDAPSVSTDSRGRPIEVMTSLAYVDGNVVVAGLSNEEFSSTLRSIPYPFREAEKGAEIEIYHGSHGRYETNAPVRTFVPYEIGNKTQLLAAYTCTPLVKIPVSELTPGNKVMGTTIAELGAGNRPLDMIVYTKGGKHFILMANSNRGVMKLPADNLEQYQAITHQTEPTGVPYETIASLQGVQHLRKLDDGRAIILAGSGDALDLRTIPLP